MLVSLCDFWVVWVDASSLDDFAGDHRLVGGRPALNDAQSTHCGLRDHPVVDSFIGLFRLRTHPVINGAIVVLTAVVCSRL
ncbi:hypothetical protein D3C81_1173650 [compost metagenome]